MNWPGFLIVSVALAGWVVFAGWLRHTYFRARWYPYLRYGTLALLYLLTAVVCGD